MKGKKLPVCPVCHRNTPRSGQTLCGRCIEAERAENALKDAKSQFYSNIDFVEDPRTRATLQALFDMIEGKD